MAISRPIRLGPAARVMIVIPSGISIPPPRPWTTRKPISMPIELAAAHSADPAVNITSAIMYSRLVPNRSAAQPVSGMTVASESVYAVTVQATVEYTIGWSGRAANTFWNVGRATLTTVMSRIDMIAPRTTTPATLRTAASIFSG
jgi:hypothetical protein